MFYRISGSFRQCRYTFYLFILHTLPSAIFYRMSIYCELIGIVNKANYVLAAPALTAARFARSTRALRILNNKIEFC